MRPCTIDDCGRVHYARGFCALHYNRWRAHGDPNHCEVGRYDSELCAFEGCGRARFSRGLCQRHWHRQRTYGDPAAVLVTDLTTDQRFWAKVDVAGADECWLWIAYIDPHGYGRFRVGSSAPAALAHRVSYEFHVGPIPEGLDIDHLCFVRACVNPAHLEAVTHTENMRRMRERAEVSN